MIPTVYKVKLSSLLSYPLGAKDLSDALAGVPQFGVLSVRFSPGLDKNPHRVESPFEILRLNYSGLNTASGDSANESDTEPEWNISVGAIPRPLRHVVKTALQTEALPKVRQWLADNPGPFERGGHAWIVVGYDAERESLTYKTSSRLQ